MIAGRVIREAETPAVQLDLVDVQTGSHLWGGRYEFKSADAPRLIQEQIPKLISRELRRRLADQEMAQVTKRHTESPEAMEQYFQGRSYWNKRSREGVLKALQCFRSATDKDPNYARAYTGLADCYGALADYSYARQELTYPPAKDMALQALRIDDSLAEAHASLAKVEHFYYWNWEVANREYRRAIELNPNYPAARHWYALCLAGQGDAKQALAEMLRGLELDPLSLIMNRDLGKMYYYTGHLDWAIEQCRKTIEMDPNFMEVHSILGDIYVDQQRYDEAVEEQLKERWIRGGRRTVTILQEVYAKSGWNAYLIQSIKFLKSEAEEGLGSPDFVARFCVTLGDNDGALEWLEKACKVRPAYMAYGLKLHPPLAGLRSDPRFAEILQRMGLPP